MTDIWTPCWSSSSAIPLAAACASASLAAASSRAALALRMSFRTALNSDLLQPSGRRGLRAFPFSLACSGAGAAAARLAVGLRVGACLAEGFGLRAGERLAGAGLDLAGDLPPVSF